MRAAWAFSALDPVTDAAARPALQARAAKGVLLAASVAADLLLLATGADRAGTLRTEHSKKVICNKFPMAFRVDPGLRGRRPWRSCWRWSPTAGVAAELVRLRKYRHSCHVGRRGARRAKWVTTSRSPFGNPVVRYQPLDDADMRCCTGSAAVARMHSPRERSEIIPGIHVAPA
jgi:hypothetical protein